MSQTIGDAAPLQAATAQAAGLWVVTGQLVHAEERENYLHHVRVELWDEDPLKDDPLGMDLTNKSGRFRITYNPRDAGAFDAPDLVLRIYELERTRDDKDVVCETKRLVCQIPGPRDAAHKLYNFGRLRVEYWEYDDSMGFPRVKRLPNGKLPQDYAKGYLPSLLIPDFPVKLIQQAHRLASNVAKDFPPLDRIQRAYPISLTQRIDAANPGASRGDEFFGDRVLNGFNPVIPTRAPGGGFDVAWRWDDYETDGFHDVANVAGHFEVEGGKFVPKQITLSIRAPGHSEPHSPMSPAQTFTPADGEKWLQAKRVFRWSWSLAGELDAHLCECHLNMEQYAIAAWRNLRRNPVRDLLFPHLREVVLINKVGDEAIFGVQGILSTNSPLTTAEVKRRLAKHLGRLDWTDWKPRQPICDGHTYAKVANLYWGIVSQYVNEFLAANQPAIVANWYELARFSEDLVRNSVPVTLDDDRTDAYDHGEIDIGGPAREEVDGVLRAVRPFATNGLTPSAQDLANLAQLCRYVIFHCTLAHTWSNDRQADDGGDIFYANLGMRGGMMKPESDWSVSPPPVEATDQLFFSHSLSAKTRGHLLANEDEDVPRRFRELLAAQAAAFDALGVPARSIRSRINI